MEKTSRQTCDRGICVKVPLTLSTVRSGQRLSGQMRSRSQCHSKNGLYNLLLALPSKRQETKGFRENVVSHRWLLGIHLPGIRLAIQTLSSSVLCAEVSRAAHSHLLNEVEQR